MQEVAELLVIVVTLCELVAIGLTQRANERVPMLHANFAVLSRCLPSAAGSASARCSSVSRCRWRLALRRGCWHRVLRQRAEQLARPTRASPRRCASRTVTGAGRADQPRDGVGAPYLVAEVKYTGWSGAGRLRHPVYLGLREDKAAGEAIRAIADPEATRVPYQPGRFGKPGSAARKGWNGAVRRGSAVSSARNAAALRRW